MAKIYEACSQHLYRVSFPQDCTSLFSNVLMTYEINWNHMDALLHPWFLGTFIFGSFGSWNRNTCPAHPSETMPVVLDFHHSASEQDGCAPCCDAKANTHTPAMFSAKNLPNPLQRSLKKNEGKGISIRRVCICSYWTLVVYVKCCSYSLSLLVGCSIWTLHRAFGTRFARFRPFRLRTCWESATGHFPAADMAKHGGRLNPSSNALKYHTTWIISSTVIPHHHCEARDCRKHSPGLRCAEVFAGNIPVFGTHATCTLHSPLLFLELEPAIYNELCHVCFPCHDAIVAKPGSPAAPLHWRGLAPRLCSGALTPAVSRFHERGARVMGIPMGSTEVALLASLFI
jgi:hypothetical protein